MQRLFLRFAMSGPQSILLALSVFVLLLVSAAAVRWASPAAADPKPDAAARVAPLAALYDRAAAASVEILAGGHLAGSGAVVQADGLVLTAAHVVEGQHSIEVVSPVLGRLPARVLAVDAGHDLALLELSRPKGAAPCACLPLAAQMPGVGDEIYLFGAPIYRHGLLLRGQVARPGTAFEWGGRNAIEIFYITANTPRGTSGGPWINARGELVGVQSSMMSEGTSQNGIAFAGPLTPIRRLIASRTSAATPTIGAAAEELWEHPPQFVNKFPKGAEGVVLRAMSPTGPAARAGLVDMDLVIAVNDTPVRLRDDFFRLIRAAKVGQDVKLMVRRPGEAPRPFVVKVGKDEPD